MSITTSMRPLHFDAFGEPVAQSLPADAAPRTSRPRGASRLVLRSGVALFWTLVVVIVAARAVYFDPDVARSFAEHLGKAVADASTQIGTLKGLVFGA